MKNHNNKSSKARRQPPVKDTPLGAFFDSMVFAASIAKRGFDAKTGILPHMIYENPRRKSLKSVPKKPGVTA